MAHRFSQEEIDKTNRQLQRATIRRMRLEAGSERRQAMEQAINEGCDHFENGRWLQAKNCANLADMIWRGDI